MHPIVPHLPAVLCVHILLCASYNDTKPHATVCYMTRLQTTSPLTPHLQPAIISRDHMVTAAASSPFCRSDHRPPAIALVTEPGLVQAATHPELEVTRVPSPQFLNLPMEKQGQIVQASLREFAENGYDRASTNRIVEQARISKGVLFKYFDDKESLFLYVVEIALKAYVDAFPAEDATSFDDPFHWLKEVTMRKIRFSQKHPLIYRFLARIAKEPEHPVYAKVMDAITATTQQYMAQIAALLPPGKLRDGLRWEQIFFIVECMTRGFREAYISQIPDAVDENFEASFQRLHDELDVYLDIIKRGVYKEVHQQ